MAKKLKAPTCPYCGRVSVFRETSFHLYANRDFGPVWECSPCRAWVGCHKGTKVPLGRLADAKLREAKRRAHAAFDPLWIKKMQLEGCKKGRARGKGYVWLAHQLGINVKDCHIGMFDVAQCERVVEVCTNPEARR